MPDTTGTAYEEQVRAGQARFRQAAAEHTARECTRQAELARAEAARREWDREIAGLCQDLLPGSAGRQHLRRAGAQRPSGVPKSALSS